jgi:DNA replicative helicase MCM subunit Mcm2 (Cdc46/Mcm family)
MPVNKADALEAILLAMLARLDMAEEDENGNVDEATQEEIDSITSLADEDALDGLVEDLNQPLPAEAPTTGSLNTLMEWLGEDGQVDGRGLIDGV